MPFSTGWVDVILGWPCNHSGTPGCAGGIEKDLLSATGASANAVGPGGPFFSLIPTLGDEPQAVEAFVAAHEGRLAARVKREVRNKLATGYKNPRT